MGNSDNLACILMSIREGEVAMTDESTQESPDVEFLEQVQADTVDITQGGAGIVQATTVNVTQGGIQTAATETLTINQGGVLMLEATDATFEMSGVGIASADTVVLNSAAAAVAVADTVKATNSTIGLLFAGTVEGNPDIKVDARRALIFGGVLIVTSVILKRVFGSR